MNREVEFLKGACPLKDHKEIDRKYQAVKNYLTEGHAGHYWLTIAERKRVTCKRGREANQGGNPDLMMIEQGPNNRQKRDDIDE